MQGALKMIGDACSADMSKLMDDKRPVPSPGPETRPEIPGVPDECVNWVMSDLSRFDTACPRDCTNSAEEAKEGKLDMCPFGKYMHGMEFGSKCQRDDCKAILSNMGDHEIKCLANFGEHGFDELKSAFWQIGEICQADMSKLGPPKSCEEMGECACFYNNILAKFDSNCPRECANNEKEAWEKNLKTCPFGVYADGMEFADKCRNDKCQKMLSSFGDHELKCFSEFVKMDFDYAKVIISQIGKQCDADMSKLGPAKSCEELKSCDCMYATTWPIQARDICPKECANHPYEMELMGLPECPDGKYLHGLEYGTKCQTDKCQKLLMEWNRFEIGCAAEFLKIDFDTSRWVALELGEKCNVPKGKENPLYETKQECYDCQCFKNEVVYKFEMICPKDCANDPTEARMKGLKTCKDGEYLPGLEFRNQCKRAECQWLLSRFGEFESNCWSEALKELFGMAYEESIFAISHIGKECGADMSGLSTPAATTATEAPKLSLNFGSVSPVACEREGEKDLLCVDLPNIDGEGCDYYDKMMWDCGKCEDCPGGWIKDEKSSSAFTWSSDAGSSTLSMGAGEAPAPAPFDFSLEAPAPAPVSLSISPAPAPAPDDDSPAPAPAPAPAPDDGPAPAPAPAPAPDDGPAPAPAPAPDDSDPSPGPAPSDEIPEDLLKGDPAPAPAPKAETEYSIDSSVKMALEIPDNVDPEKLAENTKFKGSIQKSLSASLGVPKDQVVINSITVARRLQSQGFRRLAAQDLKVDYSVITKDADVASDLMVQLSTPEGKQAIGEKFAEEVTENVEKDIGIEVEVKSVVTEKPNMRTVQEEDPEEKDKVDEYMGMVTDLVNGNATANQGVRQSITLATVTLAATFQTAMALLL
eukprot:gnl/MRDRNA2_/MRDRNA2_84932_c0_seq1.p1 gnl/MRDRNA2_/MRDRNA2_84932_c0~~gnl/MRDRNA2_/MRDRNA2_84932_c0_seq1.p1  ORF type:complete len:1023 (+),score=209.45 gnl/MRDRNA2_/MRDRNA2_84932_c0_seq1:458-3070(+)